jgi:hypothetical protein
MLVLVTVLSLTVSCILRWKVMYFLIAVAPYFLIKNNEPSKLSNFLSLSKIIEKYVSIYTTKQSTTNYKVIYRSGSKG